MKQHDDTSGATEEKREPAQASSAQRILVVDDDERFLPRLVKALVDRGFEAHGAASATDALNLARLLKPGRIVLDLRIADASGLELIPTLCESLPGVAIVLLTGYGSIPAATEAIRRGAIEVLTKPADTDEILASFDASQRLRGDEQPTSSEPSTPAATPPASASLAGSVRGDADSAEFGRVPSLAQVEWEHIQRVLADCDGNISAAARKLGIHRRTLQRKLQIRPEA